MTRKSVIERENKRKVLNSKYSDKRNACYAIIRSSTSTDEEKHDARHMLSTFPRDSSPVRQRRRCAITGRPRGVYRRFGIGRNKLRELALNGEIPGVTKSSW
jgi:small subunit ribosomal protein S14